ncbi:MAG TPA: ceramidase domain-containing protein [Polyangiales bacterium]|nr:ceramidase domain-containing protein [Polyangiales bacterium]
MNYWTRFGEASSVDWCEPNYVHSAYVAEWWNTLSSLAIVGLGMYGLWQALLRRPLELRFVVGFVTLALVGFGSMAFHGTLLRSAQATDELPMVFSGLSYVYVLLCRHDQSRARSPWILPVLTTYGVTVAVSYFVVHRYFQLFMTAYALIIAYLTVATAHVAFREDDRPEMRAWFGASVGSYVGGVVLLWLPEHVWLSCDHPLQRLQLHALFHLTSALGSYAWLRMMMHHRDRTPLAASAGPILCADEIET